MRAAADPASALTERLAVTGLVFAAIGFAVIAVSQFSYVFIFDGDAGALNADAENNAFSWASSVVTFTGGVLAFLLSFVLPQRRGRFLLLAFTLALFSFDDSLQLHEELGTRVAEDVLFIRDEWVHALWPAIFFPLLVFAFLLLWVVSRELPGRARAALRLGLGGLVVGVIAEALASAWYASGEVAETFVGALEIAIEEGAELAGWVLVVTGLAGALVRALVDLGRTA